MTRPTLALALLLAACTADVDDDGFEMVSESSGAAVEYPQESLGLAEHYVGPVVGLRYGGQDVVSVTVDAPSGWYAGGARLDDGGSFRVELQLPVDPTFVLVVEGQLDPDSASGTYCEGDDSVGGCPVERVAWEAAAQ